MNLVTRNIFGVVVLAASLMATSASSASPPSPVEERKALELFRQGREALEKGDVDTACALLEESLRLVEAAGTLLNIAQCEEKRLQLAKARGYWKRAFAKLEANDERRPLTEERLQAVEKKLGRIAVRTDGIGSTIRVDETEATVEWSDPTRGEVFLAPGRHRVAVDRGAPMEVVVQAGRTTEIDMSGARSKVPLGGDGAREGDDGPSALLVSGIVVGGVGVLALGGFAITAGAIAANDGDIEDECPDKRCSPEGLSLIEDSEALLPLNAVLLGVGAAGVGAGALLIVLGVPSRDTLPVSFTVDPSSGAAFLSTTLVLQ